MKKLFTFLLGIILLSPFFALFPNCVSADHREDVLGVASTETLSIPPAAQGPGIFLPNSPLYFLDEIKQQFRLLLAFTPEQKVMVHNAIAGERLAELRLMLVKDNVSGVRTALQGVSDNLKAASEDMTNAKLTGRNINELAKQINTSIKEKQEVLMGLESKASGEMKAQVMAASEALKVAKVKVEETLPADLLVNETIGDLTQQITSSVVRAKVYAAGINRAIGVLTKISSEAAQVNKLVSNDALVNVADIKNLINELEKASTSLQKEFPATPIEKTSKE